jgi:hypothetical protein
VQHPQLAVDLKGEGALIITRLQRSQSELELAPGLRGHLMVVDDKNGHVVAELYKPEQRVMHLALAAGRFRVQLRDGDSAFAGEVALEWGGRALVDHTMLVRQDVRDVQVKGHNLDPQRLVASAIARTGAATASSDAWLWAVGARVSVDIDRLRAFGDLQLGTASVTQVEQAHRYLETRLGVGAGPRLGLGPCELFASLSGGLLYVHERVAAAQTYSGGALGAFVSPALAIEVPIVSHLVLALQGELQLSWLRVDDALSLRARPYVSLFVGRHL